MTVLAVAVATGTGLAMVCASIGRRAQHRDHPRRGPRGPRPRGGPWLALVEAWASALASAGLEGDPLRWLRVAGASIVGLAVLAVWRGGPGGGLALVAVAVGALALGLWSARGRGPRRADTQIPDLLEHTARGLRSDLDLAAALDGAATAIGGIHGAEVTSALERVGSGATLADALRPWIEAHPRPSIRVAVGAIEVAAEAGGGRARALDGMAATLRSRTGVADEVQALASQARSSAAVMVGLPVLVAALGSAADPRLARTLLGTPLGLACVAAASLLDGLGAWWMQRIVDRARP